MGPGGVRATCPCYGLMHLHCISIKLNPIKHLNFCLQTDARRSRQQQPADREAPPGVWRRHQTGVIRRT